MGKNNGKAKINKRKKKKNMSQGKWLLIIVFWTIIIGGGTSLLSDTLLKEAELAIAFVILIIIIFIGVIFDTIGTAVTAATEAQFHSMASKKIKGAKTAINLIRNADKVSNFCNDVIGDVCGIVSGSAGAIIVTKLLSSNARVFGGHKSNLVGALIGAVIAAATIGGKALGKSIAINNSNKIIFEVSKVIHIIKKDR